MNEPADLSASAVQDRVPAAAHVGVVAVYSSQEHVVIAGEFRTPPQGSGPPPTFTVAVPAVDIDWEGRTRWDDETDEGGFIAPVLLSSNPDHWKNVIINDPRPRDVISPALTISWIPASAIMLRRMDGRSVSNGEVIHSQSESFPLSLNVVPLTTNSLFSITIEGETDSYGEKAIDKVFGTIYTAQLFVNGEDKTDGETTVVVGQNVVAELRIIPDKNPFGGPLFPAQPTFQWTIPGADDFLSLRTIKDYQPTPSSATVEHLTLEDRSKQTVSMYWLDERVRDRLSCSVDIDGNTMSLETFVTATKPTSTFLSRLTTQNPAVNVYNSTLSFGLLPGMLPDVLPDPGISFIPSIQTASGQSGQVALFQLISTTIVYYQDDEEVHRTTTEGFVLDDSRDNYNIQYVVPYCTHVSSVSANQSLTLESNLGPISDSPSIELNEHTARVLEVLPISGEINKVERMDEFYTYFMFKPTGGIWVPLKKLHWGWVGAAEFADRWQLISGVAPNASPVGLDTCSPPEWERNFHNFQ